MQEHAGRDVHQQYSVLIPMLVYAIHVAALDRNGWNTEIEGDAQQFVQFLRVLIDALNPSGLVRYADCQQATIGIGHRNDGYCQRLRVYQDALQVKRLTFFPCPYLFYRHHLRAKLLLFLQIAIPYYIY